MNTEVDMCNFPIRWVYDGKSKVLPEEVIFYLFGEFLVDPRSISCLQRTCRSTRLWKHKLLRDRSENVDDWMKFSSSVAVKVSIVRVSVKIICARPCWQPIDCPAASAPDLFKNEGKSP